MKRIKTAVNKALKEEYPDIPIYGVDTKEGYKRPSFFIETTQTFAESSKNFTHKNVEVEIQYIQKVSDESAAMDFFDRMQKKFCQKLVAGDRYLNTSDLYAGFDSSAGVPIFRFDVEYWEAIERTDSSVLMGAVTIKQEIKGDE